MTNLIWYPSKPPTEVWEQCRASVKNKWLKGINWWRNHMHVPKLCTTVMYSHTWINHIMCFFSSVSYLLSFFHLSESQLHSLQLKYIMLLKKKLWFYKWCSHDINFWPKYFFGMDFLNHWTEWGLGVLGIIIQNLQMPDYAQSIIMNFLRHWQNASSMFQGKFQFLIMKAPPSQFWRIFIYKLP